MPSSADGVAVTPNHWSCRALGPDGSTAAFFGVHSALHDDRASVTLPEAEALAAVGDDVVCELSFDDGRAVGLEVKPHVAPRLPAVWFAELAENAEGRPPAVNLLAFVDHDIAPGTLLTREQLRQVPVTSEDQLGAVRWYPETGEVDQLYVAPGSRGRNLGTALILGSGTLQASRDLPEFWSDGQRTSDGNRLMAARPEWSHRSGELTHLVPPMTPFDQR